MRKNQINKRTAGENNPVKDETAGSLPPPHPPPSSSSPSYTYIPQLLDALTPPFTSLSPLAFLATIPSLLIFTSTLSPLFLNLFLFPSSSSPILHLDFMASRIFNLALPLSPPQPKVPSSPSLHPSLLPCAELNGD